MFSPQLQYLDEAHRKQWIAEMHRQAAFDRMRKENLEAQLDAQPQNANQPLLENRKHGPFGVLKAAFSHLSGHKKRCLHPLNLSKYQRKPPGKTTG